MTRTPEQMKKYREDNKEKFKAYSKKWKVKNLDKVRAINKKSYEKNKLKRIDSVVRWRKNNPNKVKEYESKPNRLIANRIRKRIFQVLKGKSKSALTMELLGCTLEFLRFYLESKFEPSMGWENYGNPNGDHSNCWHIDHIRPCASFDLSDPEQQKICFHYTNLQPLWAKDNLSKGCKYASHPHC